VVAGRATSASNYTNYAEPVTYTVHADLQNYIPKGGQLTLTIPDQIKLVSSPFDGFKSSSGNLEPTGDFSG